MSYGTSLTSIDGLASGLNTTDIITKLMQIARNPQVQMQNAQAALKTKMAAYQSVNSKMQALGTAANALSKAAGWSVWKTASSDSTATTATATADAVGGRLSFVVHKPAGAGWVVSSGTVSSPPATIAGANGSILLAKGAGTLGLDTVSGTGLTDGNHTITVTQSSAGASITGSAVGASTTITSGVNDKLNVTVDGVAK